MVALPKHGPIDFAGSDERTFHRHDRLRAFNPPVSQAATRHEPVRFDTGGATDTGDLCRTRTHALSPGTVQCGYRGET
jgi:hypothetical protein